MVAHVFILSVGEVETGGSLGFLDQIAQTTWLLDSRPVRDSDSVN